MTGPAVSNAQIAAASALVLLAMAVWLWRRAGLEAGLAEAKTTGLVAFPGVLVGSLLAGADAGPAVRLQLVILWVLLGGVAVAALAAVALGARRLFTSAHQLVELPELPAGAEVAAPARVTRRPGSRGRTVGPMRAASDGSGARPR